MPVTPSRRIASEILLRVEKTGAYAGDLLHARLGPSLKGEDAALATELTLGVLRWRRLLDFLLAKRVGRPLEALDLEVLTALRLGLYQLRFLDRIPAHAAVNESVELVRSARKGSAAGLVNAVLRNSVSSARRPVEDQLPSDLPLAERWGILHSHPTWMVSRWLERFGEERTLALLEADNLAAQVSCVVLDPERREETMSQLENSGAKVSPGTWLGAAFAASGANVAATVPFARGWAFIQDEASQMVALLLEAGGGKLILDLCAAPGGKTALLARAASRNARVIAGDLHPSRLRAMRSRLEAAGITGLQYIGLNATRPLPFSRLFDRILADAPCSGTGTLSRNPEIRWRLEPEELPRLHDRQVKLLSQALAALAPGGRVVYATCSLETEENEDVVRAAMRENSGIQVIPPTAALEPHLASGRTVDTLIDAEGFFRTFPAEHHTDGFFAAVLTRGLQTSRH
jgi:16S rRNA (cytosine967-C5)-methyltransferase